MDMDPGNWFDSLSDRQFKVWFRLRWKDTRLSWDPAGYGGITEVRFAAASFSMPEDTEIWLVRAKDLNPRP